MLWKQTLYTVNTKVLASMRPRALLSMSSNRLNISSTVHEHLDFVPGNRKLAAVILGHRSRVAGSYCLQSDGTIGIVTPVLLVHLEHL